MSNFFTRQLNGLREAAARGVTLVKRDGIALWFVCRHSDTPFRAKVLGALIVAYALSPVDLIPDFIPLLGYLDGLILLPPLFALMIKLIPPPVLAECRGRADDLLESGAEKPVSRAGLFMVLCIWAITGALVYRWITRL